MRHCVPGREPEAAVFFGPDPALALVAADLDAWMAAHPCDCEALCVCDQPLQEAA